MTTREQREHAIHIADGAGRLILDKYKRGQEEHGGNLWEKSGLIDNAIEEAIDMVIYLLTLKEQYKDRGLTLVQGKLDCF